MNSPSTHAALTAISEGASTRAAIVSATRRSKTIVNKAVEWLIAGGFVAELKPIGNNRYNVPAELSITLAGKKALANSAPPMHPRIAALQAVADGYCTAERNAKRRGIQSESASSALFALMNAGLLERSPTGRDTRHVEYEYALTHTGRARLKKHHEGLPANAANIVPPARINRLAGIETCAWLRTPPARAGAMQAYCLPSLGMGGRA